VYKIIKVFKGSPNGSTVIDYQKGEIVDLESDLAAVALEEGWVELVDKPEDQETPEGPKNPDKTPKKRP